MVISYVKNTSHLTKSMWTLQMLRWADACNPSQSLFANFGVDESILSSLSSGVIVWDRRRWKHLKWWRKVLLVTPDCRSNWSEAPELGQQEWVKSSLPVIKPWFVHKFSGSKVKQNTFKSILDAYSLHNELKIDCPIQSGMSQYVIQHERGWSMNWIFSKPSKLLARMSCFYHHSGFVVKP